MNFDNKDPNKKPSKSKLCSFGYVDYIVLSSTISIALAEDLTSDDLNILASFLATLSDELALIAAVKVCPTHGSDDGFIPDVELTRSNFNSPKKIVKKRTIIKKRKIKKMNKT
ncbi:hypothetical protein [Romboutsia sp.]|uniref:hypothetical protein n=1 Tax=Romboutsia sp. TaxID=1965302 RepID=UPI002C0D7380|nr:hypothetical protein [Romboutsia sp.]HSQ90511.1 hypothetical protein [Romboutsia sp.]